MQVLFTPFLIGTHHFARNPAFNRKKLTDALALVNGRRHISVMKTNLQSFAPGANIVVHWEANRAGSHCPIKANRTDAGRSNKIILPVSNARGALPKPGEVWICQIQKVTGKADSRGAIIVTPMSRKLEYQFDGVYVDPVKAQQMATVLQDPRKNLMLIGDQGVGKSTIAAAVAKTLGWQYRKVSGGLIKKAAIMMGRVVPSSGDKPFEWADSKLVTVLREANEKPQQTFLLMIDEYTRIDEDARDALLDVIEGSSRSLRLSTGEDIPVPSNVTFMAAGNEGEGFTVRREDAAAKDRWEIIKVTVMPPAQEMAHCLRLYPNCPKPELDLAMTVITKVRSLRRDRKLRFTKSVSTRRVESVAMHLASGCSVELALETAIVNQFVGFTEDDTTEAGRIANLIKESLADARK